MYEKTVNVGGQQLAYLQSVGSQRTVIFVHGNSCSARTWQPLLTGPFGQRFRCLAFSLPGHGLSAPAIDPAAYSLPGYAATLAGFAGALDADDAVIVGWSLGGHIAIESAPGPARGGRIPRLRRSAGGLGRPDARGVPAQSGAEHRLQRQRQRR